jgi:hypothetical protein
MTEPVFREGTNPIWAACVGIYILAALGVDFYWLFTESGPIGWLGDVQASIFDGKWYPKLAFMLVLLAEIAPVIVLKLVLERLLGKKLA